MPSSFTSLPERVRAQAEQRPGVPAYTLLPDGHDRSAEMSFAGLDCQARAVAASLQRTLQPGDRAILIYPTGLEFAAAFHGCLYAGVAAVPVPEPIVERHLLRIQAIVQDAQTDTVLTISRLMPLVEKAAAKYPELKALRWVATDTLAPDLAADWRAPDLRPADLAFLQYTSGSTGTPRGVMVTHGNLAAQADMLGDAWAVTPETVVVSWLPLFHDMGLLTSIILPGYFGNRAVLMSPVTFLQRPLRWLKALSRYGGHCSAAPDFAYALAARKATPEACDGLDLSAWRMAANGAEPVRADTVRTFTKTFEPYGFRPEAMSPAYGLAEATLMVSINHGRPPQTLVVDAAAFEQRRVAPAVDGRPALTLVGSGTTAWRRQVVRIVDPDTQQVCAPDEVGEIWVAGEHVAEGYWQKPADTTVTFRACIQPSGEGPFMRTGDLGFIHDGELYIAGRIKDVIIIDGSNHYPQDLEQTVEAAHPAVRPGGTAAFSVDRDGQERLVVVAELNRNGASGMVVEPGQAAQAIRAALSAEHGLRLDDVVFIRPRSIFKTSSGKIQRRACREAYLSGTLEPW